MYISRVEIDYNNRQKTKDLSHLGAYHNWVEKIFPKEFNSKERSRKLWRIDKLKDKIYLLLISDKKPDIGGLELYGVSDSIQIKSYNEFLNKLEIGQTARFKATLNPIISISSGKKSGKRGKVVPHVTIEQKKCYLLNRSEKNGFHVEEDEFTVTDSRFESLRKKGRKSVDVSKVIFEGRLTITDVDLFKKVLVNGLGKKKAYGCGMITIIPEVMI